MTISIHDFNVLINNFCADIAVIENIFVVFKAAYREIDLEKESYSIEILQFEADNMEYLWLNDWNEGQKFIEFFGIYTESDILKLILSKENEK